MQWLLMGDVSFYSEENYHQARRSMKLILFTSLTRVCTPLCHFTWTTFKFETALLIYPKADSNTGATHATLSTDYHTKLVALDAPSGKEIARLEDGRHIELERKLSETLVLKTERDQHITQLTDELALKSALLKQATEEKNRAGLGQHELQAKLDELLLSRDQALEQARSALQSAAEVNERSQRELAEVHAKLEARESELTAVRLRLTNAEVGCEKSKAEADTLRAGIQAAAGLINMDVDRVVRRLMERVRSVEAEMASLRGNEKSIGEMECNEGPMKWVFQSDCVLLHVI